ncbi:hypothetical protein [Marinobacterium aestuariivivens]|uniref:Hemerythrin-like domain-containing protein n=1 Tax=Marinobacterium aestuariivivens TaxID=1698799 RepID=A0ABW2A8F0_9GAMM
MKRVEALLSLSREHHQALVVASRLGRLDDREALTACWRQLGETFFGPLRVHFDEEEHWILPLLPEGGELASRLLGDHRELRRLMDGREPAQWRAFGRCLKEHVRFEEKCLFEWLQMHYSSEQLLAAQCVET